MAIVRKSYMGGHSLEVCIYLVNKLNCFNIGQPEQRLSVQAGQASGGFRARGGVGSRTALY